MIALVILLVFNIPAYAQTGMMGSQKGEAKQQGMMGEGQQMSMMQCMPMMMQMSGQGMMMQEMMHMMMDMMKMQKKMMREAKPAERKDMMMEMDKMMEKMEKMMSEMRGMMMQGMTGGKAAAEPKKEGQKNSPQKTQEKSEAGVTVKASLEGENGALNFKIVLDTHTIELDKYKFADIVILRADGKEYKGRVISEEGSGHHRSAIVEFDNPKTKEVGIIIKDVAGVKERVFKFSLYSL